MNIRRLASFLLGVWIGGSVLMALVASQSFRSVDRLLVNPVPAAGRLIQAAGPEGAGMLLRHQISEQNRWVRLVWDSAQLGLAAGLFFLLLFASREGKLTLSVALVMLAIVLVERLVLTPEITARGRLLDFLPPDLGSAERNRFWFLQTTYTGIEAAKFGLGILLAVRLVTARKGSGHAGKKIDLVNKANYGHIDG